MRERKRWKMLTFVDDRGAKVTLHYFQNIVVEFGCARFVRVWIDRDVEDAPIVFGKRGWIGALVAADARFCLTGEEDERCGNRRKKMID